MAPALLAALALAQAPAAQNLPVELHWLGEAGCPDQATVENRIRARFAQAPAETRLHVPTLHAEASIRQAGSRFELRLLLKRGNAHSQHSATADDCGSLADATVLLITLAFETGHRSQPTVVHSLPESGRSNVEDELKKTTSVPESKNPPTNEAVTAQNQPSQSSGPEPTAHKPRLRHRARRLAPRRRPSMRSSVAAPGITLGLGAELGHGRVPTIDAGPLLALDMTWRHLTLGLDLRHIFGQLHHADHASDARIHVSVTSGSLGLCATTMPRPLVFLGCARTELGFSYARGIGVANPRSAVGFHSQLAAGPHLLWWWSRTRFGLRIGIEASLGLGRPQFALAEGGFRYQSPRFGVAGRLGVLWRAR